MSLTNFKYRKHGFDKLTRLYYDKLVKQAAMNYNKDINVDEDIEYVVDDKFNNQDEESLNWTLQSFKDRDTGETIRYYERHS